MKLPLAIPLDSRNGNGQYDARPVNVLKETSAATESVVKRPALVKVTGPDIPANGNGLVDFDGTLISVFGAQLAYAKPSYGFEESVPSETYGFYGWSTGADLVNDSIMAVPNLSLTSDTAPALIFSEGTGWVEIDNPWTKVAGIAGATIPDDSSIYGRAIRAGSNWMFVLMYVASSGDKVVGTTLFSGGEWGSISTVASFDGTDIIKLCAAADSSNNIYITIMNYNYPPGQAISVFKSDDSGSTWAESEIVI